jgi:hypothetical protein
MKNSPPPAIACDSAGQSKRWKHRTPPFTKSTGGAPGKNAKVEKIAGEKQEAVDRREY